MRSIHRKLQTSEEKKTCHASQTQNGFVPMLHFCRKLISRPYLNSPVATTQNRGHPIHGLVEIADETCSRGKRFRTFLPLDAKKLEEPAICSVILIALKCAEFAKQIRFCCLLFSR